ALTRPWMTSGQRDSDNPWDVIMAPFPEPGATISVRLINVGQGLALAVPGRCRMLEYNPDSASPTGLRKGLVSPAAIPSGADCWIQFIFEPGGSWHGNPFLRRLMDVAKVDQPMPFLVEVLFTDAAGGQRVWVRVHVQKDTSQPLVTQIDYLRDNDGVPSL